MQPNATEPPGNGLCIADGYGLKITVSRGHLTVHDGIGRQRQTRRYHRATSRLQRLIVLGQTGYITLDALTWLAGAGVSLIHLDRDGRVSTTSTAPGPGHAALRRAQALAATSSAGVEIARELLRAKVTGQCALLPSLGASSGVQVAVVPALAMIETGGDLVTLLSAEAEIARAYWQAWAATPVRFAPNDQRLVPDHWRSFAGRHSPLTSSPHRAINPANAILNYLYALLEAESTIACHTAGLDPLLGIFHADRRNRASLALDVMESARPAVDAHLLHLLNTETFSRHDFLETRDGSCRLSPTTTQQLAKTVLRWRVDVAPFAERAATMLAASTQTQVAAPLTQAYRRAAQAKRAKHSTVPPSRPNPVFNSCRDCGAGVSDRRRRYCDACRTERFAAHVDDVRTKAQSVLPGPRAARTSENAAGSRAVKNARHQQALREWSGPPADRTEFATEIWPQIRGLENVALMNATGLSGYYCSQIRLGQKVPHPRHWEALRACGSPGADHRSDANATGNMSGEHSVTSASNAGSRPLPQA